MGDVVDARKQRLGEVEALALAAAADDLYSARGKHVTYVNLKRDKPLNADVLALMLGPTGNLRAPTLRRGRSLFVGFNESAYREWIK